MPNDPSLSPEALRQVEQTCDRFEADLRTGSAASVMEYAKEVDGAARAALERFMGRSRSSQLGFGARGSRHPLPWRNLITYPDSS